MKPRGWNKDLAASYDAAAPRYAEVFFRELEQKPFDRVLLDQFAAAVAGRGLACDLGCGPGHVAQYLRSHGAEVFGLDLSLRMVGLARRLNPGISFVQGDMFSLGLADRSLAGVAAFYSLIHAARDKVGLALAEIARVLVPGGTFLLSFHGGQGEHHVDELLGASVSIDVSFFRTEEMEAALRECGFSVEDVRVRDPYDFEFPSQRAYIRAIRNR